jgi:hypothetical protein
MGRWGGEETKSQGMVGCAFAGILLLVVSWGLFKTYPAVANRSSFEKQVNKIIRGARTKKVVEIESAVMACAEKNNLPLLREDIEIVKSKRDTYTPVINAHIKIHVVIDYGWGPREVTLPPVIAEVALIEF